MIQNVGLEQTLSADRTMDEFERQRLEAVKAEILDNQSNWAKLSPRERDLLRLRVGLGDGKFREAAEIAELYGVTVSRIRLTEDKALKKLRGLVDSGP